MSAPATAVRREQQQPFDANDPDAVRQRRESSKRTEEARIRGLRVILASTDARTWLWDLLGSTGLYKSSFTGNSQTFFLEGQRNIGLMIQADIVKHSPDALLSMMKEHADG